MLRGQKFMGVNWFRDCRAKHTNKQATPPCSVLSFVRVTKIPALLEGEVAKRGKVEVQFLWQEQKKKYRTVIEAGMMCSQT